MTLVPFNVLCIVLIARLFLRVFRVLTFLVNLSAERFCQSLSRSGKRRELAGRFRTQFFFALDLLFQ